MQQKKPKQFHIKNILLRSYFSAMLVVLLVTTGFFAAIEFSNLNKNIRSSIEQANHSVVQDVDNQIKQMDTISISALYSNLLKSSFSSYSDYLNTAIELRDPSSQSGNARILHDLMFSIIGVNNDIRQINLYDIRNGGFGTGMYNGYIDLNLDAMPWYENTVAAGGKRYVTPPYQDSFLPTPTNFSAEKHYISLCRVYFDHYNRIEGAIEVTEYYDTVFASALNSDSIYNPSFYIYDQKGNLLFPVDNQNPFNYFEAYNDQNSTVFLKNTSTGREEYVSYLEAPYSDFLTVAVVDSVNFYAPILQFLFLVILLAGGAVAVCNFVAYRLTRRLAVPLTSMHSHFSSIDFERQPLRKMDIAKSNIIEIDDLSKCINQFQGKLKGSMENILLLQQQEAQAQMLALQSQMNPHFLYNSLSTIRAMAEEGMTEEIFEMCEAMTQVLRYIASSKDSVVPLEQELENTDLYLNCLKFRHQDRLTFDIEIEDSMLNIMVPKLCIQLLVENAVKFTTTSVAPPWHILISCVQMDNLWLVTVYDNGSGFSQESCDILSKQIREIDETNLLPSLELQGMGLMNLYIRLKLIYGTGHIFEFGNRKDGGGFVRIGGRMNG